VTRDAYYKRLNRGHVQGVEESVVLEFIDKERQDEPRVGTRKLYARLVESGEAALGRDALFTILRRTARLIQPKKSFVKTTYSQHSYAVAPNRIKDLVVSAPKQVLVSDITYLRIAKGGFAYLFLVTDKFSRRIVGYHVSRDLTHYSAILALDNAVRFMDNVAGTIHHSDRGCQYCCHEFLKFLGGGGSRGGSRATQLIFPSYLNA